MNKSLTTVLVVVALAIIGYYAMQGGTPSKTDDTMMNSSDSMEKTDTMMKDDAMMEKDDTMMKNDAMMESDAMKKVDADASASLKMEGDAMMKKEDAMMEKTEEANDDNTMMKKSSAAYLAYSDGVIGNGQTSVLFFHAAWCPTCRQADKDLASIYGAGTAGINTYKVDYDTQTALKEKYGVTYQHTFVLIDGTGKALKTMQGATAAELTALIKS